MRETQFAIVPFFSFSPRLATEPCFLLMLLLFVVWVVLKFWPCMRDSLVSNPACFVHAPPYYFFLRLFSLPHYPHPSFLPPQCPHHYPLSMEMGIGCIADIEGWRTAPLCPRKEMSSLNNRTVALCSRLAPCTLFFSFLFIMFVLQSCKLINPLWIKREEGERESGLRKVRHGMHLFIEWTMRCLLHSS